MTKIRGRLQVCKVSHSLLLFPFHRTIEANRLSSATIHRNFYFRSRIKFIYHDNSQDLRSE